MKKVEDKIVHSTKFEERKFTTSNLSEMRDMYLAKRLIRSWNEDFIDEDNGDIVSVERNEVIFEKGTYISGDVLSQINFYLECSAVQEVEVSNQQRYGVLVKGSTSVWSATVSVANKNRNYLLYANSMETASKIITDYLEQELNGYFVLVGLKEMSYSNLIPIEDDANEMEFYQVELAITYEGQDPYNQSYILKSDDAEAAKTSIIHFMTLKMKQEDKDETFDVTIISAKKIKCYGIVDYHFSQEYFDKEKQYGKEI